jgi:hypothetical protein
MHENQIVRQPLSGPVDAIMALDLRINRPKTADINLLVGAK